MAETLDEIETYYARRFIGSKAKLLGLEVHDFGAIARIEFEGKSYASLYVRDTWRGGGTYRRAYEQWLRKDNVTILTAPDCDLEAYCVKTGIPVLCISLP